MFCDVIVLMSVCLVPHQLISELVLDRISSAAVTEPSQLSLCVSQLRASYYGIHNIPYNKILRMYPCSLPALSSLSPLSHSLCAEKILYVVLYSKLSAGDYYYGGLLSAYCHCGGKRTIPGIVLLSEVISVRPNEIFIMTVL